MVFGSYLDYNKQYCFFLGGGHPAIPGPLASTICSGEDQKKVHFNQADVDAYWRHWREHMPSTHPAADASHSHNFVPVGVSGDDARYTLAGRKILVMMLNIVVQSSMRILVAKSQVWFV